MWKHSLLLAQVLGNTAGRLTELIPPWKPDILEALYNYCNICQGDLVFLKCISRTIVIFQKEGMVKEKRG